MVKPKVGRQLVWMVKPKVGRQMDATVQVPNAKLDWGNERDGKVDRRCVRWFNKIHWVGDMAESVQWSDWIGEMDMTVKSIGNVVDGSFKSIVAVNSKYDMDFVWGASHIAETGWAVYLTTMTVNSKYGMVLSKELVTTEKNRMGDCMSVQRRQSFNVSIYGSVVKSYCICHIKSMVRQWLSWWTERCSKVNRQSAYGL